MFSLNFAAKLSKRRREQCVINVYYYRSAHPDIGVFMHVQACCVEVKVASASASASASAHLSSILSECRFVH